MSVIIKLKPSEYPLPVAGDPFTTDSEYGSQFIWFSKGQFPNISYFLGHVTGNTSSCDSISASLAEVQQILGRLRRNVKWVHDTIEVRYRKSISLDFHSQKLAFMMKLANYYASLLIINDCLN